MNLPDTPLERIELHLAKALILAREGGGRTALADHIAEVWEHVKRLSKAERKTP